MNLKRNDIIEILRLIKGLDPSGLLLLSEAIGRLRSEKNLPASTELLLKNLKPLREINTEGIETLNKLIKLFGNAFRSDVKNGSGVNIWFDDIGSINLEVDIIRVRKKTATKENQFNALSCINGTTVFSNSAKLKLVERR
jgi:hypothetical protein